MENKRQQLQQHTSQAIISTGRPQQEKVEELQKIPYSSLFRFADQKDYILMIVGTICACAMGAALPSFALLWGNMTNSFGDNSQMVDASRDVMYNFFEIGAGALVAGWGMFGCWMITGERQGIACRKQYLKSLLKQEIGWFDTINQSQLATKFATDSFSFQEAIGEKVSTLIMTIAMFIAGFAIAFSKGWTMTLVCIASLPAIGLGGYLYSTAIAKKDTELEKEYSQAGGKAQQAIAGIKTVKQMNGQSYEAEQYAQTLKKVTKNSTKYGLYIGVGIGSLFGFMLMSYSLGFWFGSHCVEGSSTCSPSVTGGKYQPGDVLVIFFSILMAGFNFTQLTPAIKKIAEGRAAAARIFKIIDRQPLIVTPKNGIRPQSFRGVFKFEKVTFAYPKEPTKKILDGLDLQINGKSTAFVGDSGCGKSTIFQLIMRFYDPDQGRITLDGIDLKDIDLFWLRGQIGYVGQEPVLFATTLKENLLFGKEDATDAEIEQALKKAEAYDFVQALKEKLETFAGTAGSQISGGQKQRLAIARALLKNPKVLLLDEATSALDRRNEKNIQKTLNKIAQEKTTITIAHRVKTIMSCDDIFVIEKGKVLEHGRFHQLVRYKDVKIEEEEIEVSPEKAKIAEKSGFIDFTLAQNAEDAQLEAKVALKNEAEAEEEREKKERQQLLKKYESSIFGRLFAYGSHRKGLFAIGIFTCIINGVVFPIFSIFLGKMLGVLFDFKDNPESARKDANLYALIYLIIGIAAFIVNIIQQSIFTTIGEEITEKIRNQTYLKILKMPILWMDNPKNSSGALSARLASDCQTVNGLTTTYVSILIQNIANLTAGLIISFIYEWRTSLVALGLIPFMIIAGAIQMQFTTGFSAKTDSAYKDSSSLITQSMINIRTVTSFGYENMISNRYSKMLEQPYQIAVKKGNISGILFGLSQFIMYVVFALIFFLGAIFKRDNNLDLADVFTAIYSIMFAGMTAGNNSHFMPDVAAAKNSAANIFKILDSEDEDQLQIIQNSKLLTTPIKGNIEVRNASFKYETRTEHVFKNLSLQVKSGQKIGLVGSSGCGKSTIFQLLQRFYDLNSGQILIDGVNIKDYDIHHLRSTFGVVSQQPTLFNDTIGNNIRYNRTTTTKEEIVAAANAAYFNPEKDVVQQTVAAQQKSDKNQGGRGFDKNVGVKGSHISGGQKQRVAIARVMIRKPTVLLLDEATSALDSVNEKKVQASLDHLMEGKTCLQIAHRIDTIRNSDIIMVFQKGEIVEKGTYDQLIALHGHFYKLQKGLQFI